MRAGTVYKHIRWHAFRPAAVGCIMAVSGIGWIKFAVGSTLGVCVLAGAWVVFSPLLKERAVLIEVRNMHLDDNRRMAEEITHLRHQQTLFRTDPEFVEQMARRENRVRPDEIVFVFPGTAQDR